MSTPSVWLVRKYVEERGSWNLLILQSTFLPQMEAWLGPQKNPQYSPSQELLQFDSS